MTGLAGGRGRATCVRVAAKAERPKPLANAAVKALPSTSEAPAADVKPGPMQRAVSDLRSILLGNAASYLQRGPATCADCKGKGACDCPACQGRGLLDRDQARMDTMAHTWQKLQHLVGVERAEYNTQWTLTNRCMKCHGVGHIECPTCRGLGVRGAAAVKR